MKRKIFSILFALVLALSLSLVMAAPAAAATLEVGAGKTYTTIQAAIDAANPGDTITVAAGDYDENVVINKALILQGADSANITPATGHAVRIQASDVTIDGFSIMPKEETHQSAMGILIDTDGGTSNVTISNNTIVTLATGTEHEGNHGIWVNGTSGGVEPSTDLTISGNDITVGGYADAVYAAHSDPPHSGWLISGNTFSAPDGDSIDLYDVDDVTIDDNVFEPSLDSSVIITSELSDLAGPIVFTNNDVQGNTNGSMVAFLNDFVEFATGNPIPPDTSIDNLTITGNTFDNWGSRALRIGDNITSVTINENEFLGEGTGLKIEGNEDIDAENNYWGSANGPDHTGNTFNAGDQGVSIDEAGAGAVDFVPWYDEDKDGDSFAPVTSEDGDFSSIQAAVDNVTAGDNITCAAGTYTEDVSIDKSLTLQSEDGAEETAIYGYVKIDLGWGSAPPVAETVVFDGFTVAPEDWVAVWLDEVNNGSTANITNCIIYYADEGIYCGEDTLDNGSTVNIFGNTIYDCSYGIQFDYVMGGSQVNIIDNTIYDNNDYGIYISDVSEDSTVTITGNIVGGWYDAEEETEYGGNDYSGIIIGSVSDSTVTIGGAADGEGNTIANNGWVDGPESAGITIWYTDNATVAIQGNIIGEYEVDDYGIISGNYWTGIYLGGDGGLNDSAILIGGDTPAAGNLISGNAQEGICAEYLADTSLQILNNDIMDNGQTYSSGEGIYIWEVDEDSSVDIHYNSIVNNYSYGLDYEDADVTVDARYNWWGDVAGPYDDGGNDYYNPYNSNTGGDYVYGDVDYIPWLIQSELEEGWNIWSRPIVPDEDSWEQFKADLVAAGVDTIYYFNSATQLWGLDPDDSGLIDAWYIKAPDDLRIRYYFSSEATMPSQKAMKVGWNFIGLAQLHQMNTHDAVSDAYYGTGVAGNLAGYSKVMSPSLNGATWTYLRDGGDGPPMRPGRGYWVFMVNNGTQGGFTTTPIVEEPAGP